MKKILITGATSGIGRATAKALAEQGHHLLVHGRSASKVDALKDELGVSNVEGYVADLSKIADVESFATEVVANHDALDVLINNAGVLATRDPTTPSGLDVRFVVNTLAPFVLTDRLSSLLGKTSRVLNLSSAAQQPVHLSAFAGEGQLADFDAYAQSKLAITMWSCHVGRTESDGPIFVAINPGSMLDSAMVKEAFGSTGKPVTIGSDILVRAALSDDFADASGKYFDNDRGQFSSPHPDALDPAKCEAIIAKIKELARARHAQ